MIWLTKSEVEPNTGRIGFTIKIDAKAARIDETSKVKRVQIKLDKKINDFSNDIRRNRDYSEYEQDLKEYLCNDLFRYSINIIAVNDFIYDLKTNILKYSENIAIAGFSITYVYKNYEGEIIMLTKAEVGSGEQVYYTVLIDAAAANIRNRDEKVCVESELSSRMIALAHVIEKGYDSKEKEDDLSYYLRRELFYNFVNLKVIAIFIDSFKHKVNKFMENIKKIGFEIQFEYKNHPWEAEDEDRKRRWRWGDKK